MDAQILDVDCAQVGLGKHECAWSASFRAGTVRLSETGRATQVQRRDRQKGYTYVVRLWCRTKEGMSICVVVSDPWSTSYRLLKEKPASELANLAAQLQRDLCAKAGAGGLAEVRVVRRRTTRGYVTDSAGVERTLPWLQVRVASAFIRGQLTAALRHAQEQQRVDAALPQQGEARVEVHSELLEALGLRPGGWLRISSSAWAAADPPRGFVFCDRMLQVRGAELSPARAIEEIAPVRLLSWDIECHSPSWGFPAPDKEEDRVIAIGVCCRTLYASDAAESRVVIALGDVAIPDGGGDEQLTVVTCATEQELFEQFAEAVAASDADVLVGYNTCGFDWRYLRVRMKTLGCLDSLLCQRWSRLPDLLCCPEEQQLGSSAMGDNPLCYPRTPGRVGVDLWFVLKRQNSPDLPNLKLNTVSRHYLNDEKVDLPAKQMFAEYERGPEGRYVVAEYCCKDCVLVLDLMERLCVLPELLEMANVTCTIPEDLLYRGQQIKVYTQLLLAAHSVADGPLYVVEDPMESGHTEMPEEDGEEATQDKYKGAHVEEPKTGYYKDPIVTVDFASLYPSLMRTYNLSPDTLLTADSCDPAFVPHVEIETAPERPPLLFVKSGHKRGLMPRILDALLQERKRVKRAMNAEEDKFKRSLLNAKQLALKISANSVYGACGATRGLLQCREVAEATTATGRDIIAFTKKELEESFEAASGCEVIYGDSVTGDTALVVRRNGVIETTRIDELVENMPANPWTPMAERGSAKQEVHFEEGSLQVWHEGGFTAVRRLIRHRCAKPLMRVLTHTGLVDCTTDHSLVRNSGETVSPMDVSVGDELLHAGDEMLLRALGEDTSLQGAFAVKEAFAMGLFAAAGSCARYDTKWGAKYSWAIRNKDWALLSKVGELLPFRTRILDTTLSSSGLYQLVPVGGVKRQALRYRALFYNRSREKRVPAALLSAPLEVVVEFWNGFYAGDGERAGRFPQRCTRIDQMGKEMAAGLWLLGRRLGYRATLSDSADTSDVLRLTLSCQAASTKSYSGKPASQIQRVSALGGTMSVVYDLETESHHFHVAPGNLVVHNTDSAFVRLPPALREASEEAIFKLGEDMAAFVTRRFGESLPQGVREHCVVTLEMEKYLRPLVLYKKKRYVGKSFEEKGKGGKLLVKGIELVRRDAVPLVRRAQADVVDALLEQQNAELAISITKAAVLSVLRLQAGGPFDDVVLSKSLRQTYANPEGMPHVKVASLMDERNAGSAPRVGDRVEYIVVASESSRVVDRVEDVGHAAAAGLPPDWLFYVEALERPMLRMLEVPLRFLDESLSSEMQLFFAEKKKEALALRRKYCMARYGLKWVSGIASKSGPPQQKLTTLWAAQSVAASREAPPPAPQPRSPEGRGGANAAPGGREPLPAELPESVASGPASCTSDSSGLARPTGGAFLGDDGPTADAADAPRTLLCDTGARKRKAPLAKGGGDSRSPGHGSGCLRLLRDERPAARKVHKQGTLG